jgi:hypothetical protein
LSNWNNQVKGKQEKREKQNKRKRRNTLEKLEAKLVQSHYRQHSIQPSENFGLRRSLT